MCVYIKDQTLSTAIFGANSYWMQVKTVCFCLHIKAKAGMIFESLLKFFISLERLIWLWPKDIMNACEISKQKYIFPVHVLGLLILPISFCSKPTKKLLKFQHFFHHLLLIN